MPLVLLIDDEAAILEMYQTKLKNSGYEVITASNGPDGVALAKEKHPALIMLDIIMPQVNGLDILKTLKETPETKDIPVFMTTNLPEQTSGQKAHELGAVSYLVKAEYEPGMVVDVIDRYLKKKSDIPRA